MFPVQLKPGIRYKLFDDVYTILKLLPNLKVETEEEKFKTTKVFTQTELVKHLSNGDLKFECTGKNLEVKSEYSIKTSFFLENLEDSKHKERAIFKYEVILPILKLPFNQRNPAIMARVQEINSLVDNPLKISKVLNGCTYHKPVSYTSIYRWIKDFTESGGDVRSLFPSYHCSGGKGKKRIHPQITDFINETIDESYNNKQRITIKELWYYIIAKITEYNKFSVKKLVFPPYSSIARYLSEIPEFDLVSKRIGKRTAENKFKEIGDGVEVNYPLERVEIDHTPVDVILVDENGSSLGRPYLVLAIDKFSRNVLGFSIGISNGVGWPEVMQCIKHIISDKSYTKEIYPFIENKWNAFGIPKTLVIDNGLEFKNNAMKDACYQLGFVLQFCPPKVPQWKGSIERFFGTANTNLFHNLPGTTRSNPTKLGDDENPTKTAGLTFSAFIALVHKWIIDVYTQDLNKGAGGIPALIWEKAVEQHPVWPNSISETAILLGRTAYRKVSRQGIELGTLHYNCNELNKLLLNFTQQNKGKDEDFLIKYDPQNLGEVYVYDHLINKKWIKVPCTNPNYAKNLSEWEHKEMKAYAKKQFGIVDIEALAKAKFHIRKMIENGIGYTEKEVARAKKVTSEQEISNKLRATVNSTTDSIFKNAESCKIEVDNLSDIGCTITVQENIIPEALFRNEGNENSKKIIKMHNGATKKEMNNSKMASKSIMNPNNNFNEDDFSGFEIISGTFEVT